MYNLANVVIGEEKSITPTVLLKKNLSKLYCQMGNLCSQRIHKITYWTSFWMYPQATQMSLKRCGFHL